MAAFRGRSLDFFCSVGATDETGLGVVTGFDFWASDSGRLTFCLES